MHLQPYFLVKYLYAYMLQYSSYLVDQLFMKRWSYRLAIGIARRATHDFTDRRMQYVL